MQRLIEGIPHGERIFIFNDGNDATDFAISENNPFKFWSIESARIFKDPDQRRSAKVDDTIKWIVRKVDVCW